MSQSLPPSVTRVDSNTDSISLDERLALIVRQRASKSGRIDGHLQIRIGKYRLTEQMGSGGQAHLFGAVDEDLDRKVVVKLYRNGLSESDRQRVFTEGRALARIDSPFVARCYSVETEEDGSPFLVLEYVDGVTLEELAAVQDLNRSESLYIVEQIARGVQASHRNGLLHLDLKPENVLVTSSGGIKLIDFGLSQSSTEFKLDNTSGTPRYLAPERANNRIDAICEATDVFGIGAILYFLSTGMAPFAAENAKKAYARAKLGVVTPPQNIQHGIDPDLGRLCMNCLEQEIRHRIPSVGTLLRNIDRLRRPKKTKRPIAWITAVVAVFVLVIASVALTTQELPTPLGASPRQTSFTTDSTDSESHQEKSKEDENALDPGNQTRD